MFGATSSLFQEIFFVIKNNCLFANISSIQVFNINLTNFLFVVYAMYKYFIP